MSDIPQAETVEEIFPGVYRWEVYSPDHRVALTSHALVRSGELFVFDPIPLVADQRRNLVETVGRLQILLTSENHFRATDSWQREYSVQVHAMETAGFKLVTSIPAGSRTWNGFELRPLAGGPAGEVVYVDKETGMGFGGDAVVNLPDRELEILPEKYCSNRPALVAGTKTLSDLEMLFPAHGDPIGPGAGNLIARLK